MATLSNKNGDYRNIPTSSYQSRLLNRTLNVRAYRQSIQHLKGSRFINAIGPRQHFKITERDKKLLLRIFSWCLHNTYSIADISDALLLNDFDLRQYKKIAAGIKTKHTKRHDEQRTYAMIHGIY